MDVSTAFRVFADMEVLLRVVCDEEEHPGISTHSPSFSTARLCPVHGIHCHFTERAVEDPLLHARTALIRTSRSHAETTRWYLHHHAICTPEM